MSSWSDTELNELVESVIRRAAVDREFRQLAVADPSAALAKFASKPVDIKIRFLDMQGPEKTIILPALIYRGGDLSTAELEAVAGGTADDDDDDECMWTCICTGGCCWTGDATT